jgi:hypothetical protein
MDSISAITILMVLFAVGDLIAAKTKGTISMVLFVSIALLVGFWVGLPKTIIDDSKILSLSTLAAAMIIISVGTLIDFDELIQQWRVVILAILSIIAISLAVFLVGEPLIGKLMAITGAPIVMGGTVAVIIMTSALKAKGIADLAIWCVLLYIMHKFVGIPIASVMLKREGNRVVKLFRENLFVGETDVVDKEKPRRSLKVIPDLPKALQTPFVLLAKVCIVAAISAKLSALTNGTINVFIMYLFLGVILTEIGFLEKDILKKANSNGIIMFMCLMIVFASLTQATPQIILSFIKPLLIILCIAVVAILVTCLFSCRMLKFTREMAIAIGVCCFFGFPTSYYICHEVANAVGQNEAEKKIVLDHILPKMIIAGFVTISISSVCVAGFMVNLL